MRASLPHLFLTYIALHRPTIALNHQQQYPAIAMVAGIVYKGANVKQLLCTGGAIYISDPYNWHCHATLDEAQIVLFFHLQIILSSLIWIIKL